MNEVYDYVQEVFAPTPVYLVGGSVRDHLLGRECKDYDFAVKMHPDEITATIRKAGRRAYLVGARFGTIGFKTPDGVHYIEVTSTRGEEYTEGSRHPVTVYGVDLAEDLSRRDFTMNAIAYRKGKLIDPFDGELDLRCKNIRAVGNPTIRFKEDPLRMLRAARFAAQLGFGIDTPTFKSMQKNAHKILHVSKERWCSEIDKLLASDYVVYGMRAIMDSGLMKYIIPELAIQFEYDQNSRYHDYNLWQHTMLVTLEVPEHEVDLRWAALLHDVGKPFVRINKVNRSIYPMHEVVGAEMTDHILRRLKFSNERREHIVHIVRNHLEDDSPLREYDNKHKTGIPTMNVKEELS